MNSIKEIKEQLGYEEIGLDDTFVFHCTQCGKCCIHRDDILLSPKDLFNIAKKFQITPENALEQYCETYIHYILPYPLITPVPVHIFQNTFFLFYKYQFDLKIKHHNISHLHILYYRTL